MRGPVWTRVTGRNPGNLEKVSLEIVGAENDDSDGQMLLGFNETLLAREILEKTGVDVAPERIYFLSEVNGIGLYRLQLYDNSNNQKIYKLWIFSCSIVGLPQASTAFQYSCNSA